MQGTELIGGLESSAKLADDLALFIARSVASVGGSTRAVNPGNRVQFQWPPHPESYGFHLHRSDWTEKDVLEIGEEQFEIEIADTDAGVFGRVPELWYEARGNDKQRLKDNLAKGVQPLLDRQHLIAQVLERPGRFAGRISDLEPIDHLKLLYCPDRDVANDGRREIETSASTGIYFPALNLVLTDRTHPYRRSAQWAVLDLFEDLHCYTRDEADAKVAIASMKELIWDATDDYARTIYKAGVVLGGHMPYWDGARALVECLQAPSKIGRRSAIHGVYHLAEWAPEHRDTIVQRLTTAAEAETEPLLKDYAMAMAKDIIRADTVHVEDPIFPEEIA